MSHGLLDGYPVLLEKKDELVAQFKWTVPISNKRVVLLTSSSLDLTRFESDKTVSDADLKALLAIDLDTFSKKKKDVAKKQE